MNRYKNSTNSVLANLCNVEEKKKETDDKVEEKQSKDKFNFLNNVRLKLMTPLQCIYFMIKSNMSYPQYEKVKKYLDSLGYHILRSSSDIAYLRSMISKIIAQRLNFRLYEERKAIALDFSLFFGQLNEWIDKHNFTLKNMNKMDVDKSKLKIIFRTDGTPSSNKKKPFLVFGFSVIYNNEELAFTEEKIKFFPCVISFAEECNEEFNYWAKLVKDQLKESNIPEDKVFFSMDGGGFLKWIDNKNKTPYCNCTGQQEWMYCYCDFFYFGEAEVQFPSLRNRNVEFLLGNEKYDSVTTSGDIVVALETDHDPTIESNEVSFKSLFSKDEMVLYLYDNLDKFNNKNLDLLIEEKNVLKGLLELKKKESSGNIDKESVLKECNLILETLPKEDIDAVKKKQQIVQEKFLEMDLDNTRCTINDLKEIFNSLHFKIPDGNKADYLIYGKQCQTMLKEGHVPTPFGNVDVYWLSKFVICIMHGDFRLANRIIMFLFGITKTSSFYFPRFALALVSCKIHFNIYHNHKTKQYKVRPLSGHDTDKLFKFINQIIDFCVPIKEFILDVDYKTLVEYIREKDELKNFKGTTNNVDLRTLKEQIHLHMVKNGTHSQANRIKEVFKEARDRYVTLRKGFSTLLF